MALIHGYFDLMGAEAHSIDFTHSDDARDPSPHYEFAKAE
jgi:hypothetical protein